MTLVRRDSWVIALVITLFVGGLVCVAASSFAEVSQQKCVGTVVFDAQDAGEFNVDGIETLRELAVNSGKDFQIVALKTAIKWQWPPWESVQAYRDAVRRNPLWELRVSDTDQELAINAANTLAVETQNYCEQQFDDRYSAWLKTLSPARYHLEAMGPRCGRFTGIKIWEAAGSPEPRSSEFWDSLSRSAINAVIW